MRKSILLSSAVFFVFAVPAFADDTIETVVVSATRVPTPLTEIASSVTVISADQIAAKQERSLPDVLSDVPGLNVVQSGGPGGQTSVFMRGTNSNHTKILIDGIDVADPSNPNGSYDIGKLLTGDIASVEVLRGPQSGLYGSDAIGGVINIVTKAGEGPARWSLSAEGGSLQSFNQNAAVSGSSGGFHYALDVQHDHSGAIPVTPLDLLQPGEMRNDDFDDNVTVSGKFGYDVTDNFDLGLVTRYISSREHITGDDSDPITFASFPSPNQTHENNVEYQTRATAHLVLWDGKFDQMLGIGYSSNVGADFGPSGSFPNSGNRIKIDWQGNITLGEGELLVLGAEHARDAMHLPISAGISTDAGYAELQSSVGVSFFNTVALRYDSNSQFGDKLTWRVAPAYVIADTGTKLKASIGTGFKAPSLEDLYESFPAFFFFANPNLKPETSLGYDIGIEQALADGRVDTGVTYFHNAIKNLIGDNSTFTMDVNIGRATTQGVESFVSWKVSDTLNLRADYTYTEAYDAVLKQELSRRPKTKVSLNAAWQAMDALSLNATLLYVGPMIDSSRDFSVPRLVTGGYTTVNLEGDYALTDKFDLFARVDNLLDRRYENPTGFLAPGLGYYLGVKAKL
jgi:vitamin B12 transporter